MVIRCGFPFTSWRRVGTNWRASLKPIAYLPLRDLCERLGVSEATARRDLAELAKRNRVKRTHGGALSEFNERFPSFNERRALAGPGKQRVAKAAARFVETGGTYFLDSGTTIFAMAEFLREGPVTPATIVTSNIPMGELLAGVKGLNSGWDSKRVCVVEVRQPDVSGITGMAFRIGIRTPLSSTTNSSASAVEAPRANRDARMVDKSRM